MSEPGATYMRHVTGSSTPRAHATAALIGDTWVTTTTSPRWPATARSSQAARTRRRARRGTPRPAGGTRGRSATPPTVSAGMSASGTPSKLAVVELDPTLVDLDGRRPPRSAMAAAVLAAAPQAGSTRPARPGARSAASVGQRRGLGDGPRRRAAGRAARAGDRRRWRRSGRAGPRMITGAACPVSHERARRRRVGEAEGPPQPTTARRRRPAPWRRATPTRAVELRERDRRRGRRRGTATRTASPSPTCASSTRCRNMPIGTPSHLRRREPATAGRQHHDGQQRRRTPSERVQHERSAGQRGRASGTSAPAATKRTSRAGLWNTTQTRATESPTNQRNTRARPASLDDEQAVALRAGGDALVARLAPHRLDLGGRQRQVAAEAPVARRAGRHRRPGAGPAASRSARAGAASTPPSGVGSAAVERRPARRRSRPRPRRAAAVRRMASSSSAAALRRRDVEPRRRAARPPPSARAPGPRGAARRRSRLSSVVLHGLELPRVRRRARRTSPSRRRPAFSATSRDLVLERLLGPARAGGAPPGPARGRRRAPAGRRGGRPSSARSGRVVAPVAEHVGGGVELLDGEEAGGIVAHAQRRAYGVAQGVGAAGTSAAVVGGTGSPATERRRQSVTGVVVGVAGRRGGRRARAIRSDGGSAPAPRLALEAQPPPRRVAPARRNPRARCRRAPRSCTGPKIRAG